MLIAGFPAGDLQANCYVVAPAAGATCVIVDPGDGAAEGVAEICAEHDLTPAGVLLTHGHFDHVGAAAELCDSYDIPVHIGAADAYMLSEPLSAVSAQFRQMVAGTQFPPAPRTVVPLDGSGPLPLADLPLSVIHVPGHTGGSCTYHFAGDDGRPDVLCTGDTLFAGSIGRTDLPGGDGAQILRSIHGSLMTFPDDTVVLAGHGPTSTIGDERAANPFLQSP
jgi:hydroxyacylglutathione hydrolase